VPPEERFAAAIRLLGIDISMLRVTRDMPDQLGRETPRDGTVLAFDYGEKNRRGAR
jgi:hypothetical protein